MFGRGNWAVLGLAKESLENFKNSLENRATMLAASQVAASSITRNVKVDALGFNPFSAPRLDEQHPLTHDQDQELARFAAADTDSRPNVKISQELADSEAYAYGLPSFQIHPTMPWFGLWAVWNQWKDVSDLASIKEQQSYSVLERPYKFLQSTDKKNVDQDIRGVTAAVRKQFPVLLDFNDGRVYIENSNKKIIQETAEALKQLKLEIIAVGWIYNRANWPAAILNKLYQGTEFHSDFQKRADELTRFRAKEIEKLEDRELESIVTNYFSMTQLPGEMWAGISSPARVRLHATSQPIAVNAPANATTLLGMTEEAQIMSGAVTFQERITYLSKKGEERTFRKDTLTIDINDQMNLTDVGAAMLRGFDAPAFKKDIQRDIKKTKTVPSLEAFWGNWLHQMSGGVRLLESCFREALDLDGDESAGIVPMQSPVEDEEELDFETV